MSRIGMRVRIAAGAVLLLLLYLTIAAGLAGSLRGRAPAMALRLAPWDARAAGQLSQSLILSDPRSRDRAADLAARALQRDPTVVPAVVTLGTASDLRGNREEAEQYFSYSEALSRRNLLTQLWRIEQAIAREDIPTALRHYNIALRAIRQSRDILFPVLGSAIAEADIRRHLVPLLRTGPSWGPAFFEWLVVNGVQSQAAAELFQALAAADHRIEPGLPARLQQRLIEQQDHAAAWAYYRSAHPGARIDRSRDDEFRSAATGVATPFDWNVVADQGAATISQVEGRPVLAFSTLPTEGGVMARQFQLLPSGRYRLRDAAEVAGDAEAPPVYWALRCADGRELGRVVLGISDGAAERTLTVPGNCPAQWLVLASDAGDALQGREGTVHSVVVEPDGGRATARRRAEL